MRTCGEERHCQSVPPLGYYAMTALCPPSLWRKGKEPHTGRCPRIFLEKTTGTNVLRRATPNSISLRPSVLFVFSLFYAPQDHLKQDG
jgi:hypothetical protein